MAVDIKRIRNIAHKFVATASALFPVERALLFGSYARGTQHDWSDLDIALFLHDLGGRHVYEIAGELASKGDGLVPLSWDTYIEPHVFTSDKLTSGPPFIEEILRTGYEIVVPTPQ